MSASTSASNAPAPKLSVAVIVRDAADALSETLACIASIADEIVVADTGSADDSPAVAKAAGAKVVEAPWQDDFAAARNFCASHVTGQWVLWLDAGETLSPADAEVVRQTVNESNDATSVYAMLVETPPTDPAGDAEQIARVRLLPNHAQLRFHGKVRESIDQSFASLSLTLKPLSVRVLRSRCDCDPATKEAKARRNIRIAEAEMNEAGEIVNAVIVNSYYFNIARPH